MAYQHSEGWFSAFPNRKKAQPKHPDFRGEGLINGVLYNVAVWKKTGTKGEFFSIKIELPREREQQQEQPPKQREPMDTTGLPPSKVIAKYDSFMPPQNAPEAQPANTDDVPW
jgi:hypothetical protein